MFPAIHFNYLEVEQWAGTSNKELYNKLQVLRKAIKKAAHYRWDNEHFYIENIFGKIALIVGVYENSISFWEYSLGYHILETKTEDLTKPQIRNMIDKVSNKQSICHECHKYIPLDKLISYSFAGAVCRNCYNPEKHLPPDTSGS